MEESKDGKVSGSDSIQSTLSSNASDTYFSRRDFMIHTRQTTIDEFNTKSRVSQDNHRRAED